MQIANLLPSWLRQQKSTPMSSATLSQLLAGVFGGGPSKSGATVTVDTALQVSAVLGCTRVIAEGIAQVPFRVMRETTAGTRTTRLPATQHPLYDLLHRKPNPWQTSYGLRETMAYHAALCGNAYAFKNRVGAGGKIAQLIVIPPARCKAEVLASSGELTYTVTGRSGEQRAVRAEDIWHLRGPSWDGLLGMDTLRLAREAIGLAMSTEETQATLHSKGVSTSGVFSIEGTLNKEQYEQLKGWMVKEFGAGGKGAPMILDRNAKWHPTTMTGVDAQHLETRREQIAEVCRFFGVMPIMAGYSDKAATFASAEAMFLAHIVHCLSPRWTMFEQSADANLLTEKERSEGFYFDFVEEGMIRGSVRDTKDALLGYVNGGLMTPNEGRAKLDLNPDDDPDSDKLRIPVNVAQEAPPPAEGSGTPAA